MGKGMGIMRASMEGLRREAGRHPVLFSFMAAAVLNFLVEVLSRRSLWKPVVFLVMRPHILL